VPQAVASLGGKPYAKYFVPLFQNLGQEIGDHFFAKSDPLTMMLLDHALQNHPSDLVLGPSEQGFLNEITQSPAFAQKVEAIAKGVQPGKTVTGTTTITFSSGDLFYGIHVADFNYSIVKTGATHYQVNVTLGARYTFPLHLAGFFQSPQTMAGWTANDVAMVFERGGVINGYNWHTSVLHVSGNLATNTMTIH
jgi:hypothetical protein